MRRIPRRTKVVKERIRVRCLFHYHVPNDTQTFFVTALLLRYKPADMNCFQCYQHIQAIASTCPMYAPSQIAQIEFAHSGMHAII